MRVVSFLNASATELVAEHAALLRRLAQLQQRVSEQCRAGAVRQAVLEAENLCLRAELVVLRTAAAWGLRGTALNPIRPRSTPRPSVVPSEPPMREARSVICQTGCTGHAHPWLGDDGQCRLSGQACERVTVDTGQAQR